jgi:hypothetical protein
MRSNKIRENDFYRKFCEVLQNIVLFVSGVKLPVLLEIYNGI